MRLILASKEMTERNSLMHYRTRGSKNGERLYQNKDGSLTPLGRIHYGVGKPRQKGENKESGTSGKSGSKKTESNASKKSDRKSSLLQRRIRRIEKKHEKNRPETRKEARENKKQVEKDVKDTIDKINAFAKANREGNKPKDKTGENAEKTETKQLTKEAVKSVKNADQSVLEAVRAARKMSDDELNKQITRLQNEKRFAELMRERETREKGPFRAAANKLFAQAAEDLAKKSLTAAVDTLVGKLKENLDGKKPIKLSDYKDTNLYSLDSNKLAAINTAFQNAANISRNRYAIEHPGGKQ